ncbi:protein JINGUBANG-like [Euphorbia lathyris]|uniref:protein JINGUBANG-like n=1 Tax=Euphorbia lathyris TaxID=212925 RepID=UPI003313E623
MISSLQSNIPPSTPLLSFSTTTSSDESSDESLQIDLKDVNFHHFPAKSLSGSPSYRSLAVLSGHIGSISCLALCGEFILSASQGKDIIVWQQPDLKMFTKFGQGEGSVKALVTVGNKVFTAHQDSKIRVWKVTRNSENVFKLIDSLPTTKDYLGKFMKKGNYVQTRRHHKKLWIEHHDSISCLTVCNGLIYSGSWDKTLKVWRISDLKCLESIQAHDDAINGLVSCKGSVFSASADGKIKIWGKGREGQNGKISHLLKGILEGHEEVSVNSVVVSEDGRWVYGGGSDGYIIGFEGYNGNFVSETKAHEMAVLCMCLIGEFLCSGSADKSIGIWRRGVFGKLSKVWVINGHEGPVKCLQAASSNNVGDGFLVYSGGLDKSLRVWWVPKQSRDAKRPSSETENALDFGDDERCRDVLCTPKVLVKPTMRGEFGGSPRSRGVKKEVTPGDHSLSHFFQSEFRMESRSQERGNTRRLSSQTEESQWISVTGDVIGLPCTSSGLVKPSLPREFGGSLSNRGVEKEVTLGDPSYRQRSILDSHLSAWISATGDVMDLPCTPKSLLKPTLPRDFGGSSRSRGVKKEVTLPRDLLGSHLPDWISMTGDVTDLYAPRKAF